MAEPDRATFRAVRAGAVELDEVLARLDDLTTRLERAAREPGLAPQPDTDTVDGFLAGAYRRAWDDGHYAR